MTGGDLVSLDQVREAAERLKGVAIPTPTLPSAELSDLLDGEVRLKCESLQRAGAFKIRGAYNFISRLPREALDRGVITYSSGNHAQAVALAAGIMGARSVVVMPTTAPDVKRRGAERLGAEVVLEGTTSLERRARAEEIAEAEGLTIVPPFDDPRIIAGQGTVGLEIHEAWPDVQAVLVPVGGGGLLSGIAATLRRVRPEVVILGVEPRGAASMRLALDEGRPAALDTIETIADGLAPVRAGELTFRHVRDLVDDVVTVDDDAIRDATRFLLVRQKLVVEFSGAATVAALRSGVVSAQGRRVVAVLSGGNAEPSALRELLE
ncbi:MAG: pyridoxal-phosphate dependent enzyme [Gemmatimonadetes bacterium]|nr:pyridoxal-phosphate dependent enzyme [Gemmatimonadota bacterium]NIR81130.1 pyridoxal-phosphate dependent enzyme [Gemmatimonadota bacterium]NIT89954.1 pyridoxal-phosphate dependent enzyme [Gemmatimonadota bacterium]NIU33755.1 pyridoxal-phosphate dependent enzyme [Gemmatimonadota bacterium]NIU37986.1 pyridoxal-phosphate dependent enzyme [Gemmatimonadota bacterium]